MIVSCYFVSAFLTNKFWIALHCIQTIGGKQSNFGRMKPSSLPGWAPLCTNTHILTSTFGFSSYLLGSVWYHSLRCNFYCHLSADLTCSCVEIIQYYGYWQLAIAFFFYLLFDGNHLLSVETTFSLYHWKFTLKTHLKGDWVKTKGPRLGPPNRNVVSSF